MKDRDRKCENEKKTVINSVNENKTKQSKPLKGKHFDKKGTRMQKRGLL